MRRRMARKKKKKAGDSSSCLIPVLDDDLLVDQILSRLPVKSLMRLKCVCKAWKSTIERDSHFMDLHYAHSQSRLPGFLIIPDCRYINKGSGYESSFFSAELHCDDDSDGGRIITGATIHRLGGSRTIRSSCRIVRYLGPVRGLLCLVDDRYDVRIYNVSTGEAVTQWIRSAVDMDRPWILRKCGFGFDPSTGKHKVVFMWEDCGEVLTVVLTVGVNARWREIDQLPPFLLQGDISVYANGSIYWINSTGDMPGDEDGPDFDEDGPDFDEDGPDSDDYSEFLLAFDIGSEEFRTITIPDSTYWGYTAFPYLDLLEMDGCLTLVCGRCRGKEPHTVKMWKFHDYNKLQGINGTSSSSSTNQQTDEDWSELTIELPPYVDVQPEYSYWYPIPGKDLMILRTYNQAGPPLSFDLTGAKSFSFYSYNMVNKTLSKFEVQGTSSIPDGSLTSDFFSESLFSVQ